MTVATQQPTKVTSCEHCGKQLKGERYYPGFCNGRCLAARAWSDLVRRADEGRPLFDNMKCGCCDGELKVYADPANLRDPKADHTWHQTLPICDPCSFRRCPRGEQCSARRTA